MLAPREPLRKNDPFEAAHGARRLQDAGARRSAPGNPVLTLLREAAHSTVGASRWKVLLLSVLLLLPGVGSVVPVGSATVTVFTRLPVAVPLTRLTVTAPDACS